MSPTPKTLLNSNDYGKRLADRRVDHAVLRALRVHGWHHQDREDGLGEVRLRAVACFNRGLPPPATVGGMTALCAKIARDYAIDVLRRKDSEERDGDHAGLCEDPDAFVPVEPSGPQRDPVDAARQLEVAAGLFREGRMPDGGVEILEGIASGCTYEEVAKDLGISSGAVQGRLKTMRRQFNARIAERAMG